MLSGGMFGRSIASAVELAAMNIRTTWFNQETLNRSVGTVRMILLCQEIADFAGEYKVERPLILSLPPGL